MARSKMNLWATYSSFFVVVVIFGGLGAYVYYDNHKIVPQVEELNLTAKVPVTSEEKVVSKEDEWKIYFPEVKTMTIGQKEVQASIAKSWPDRIKGLSDTPYLPDNIVKIFVFDSVGFHSIWMKDMNYSIDIIWVDESKKIVHIVEGASPDSYPEAFIPEIPAKYVIETAANFVSENRIMVGDDVVLPNL